MRNCQNITIMSVSKPVGARVCIKKCFLLCLKCKDRKVDDCHDFIMDCYCCIFSFGLKPFFSSRNAGFGLRFPFAFHTLKGWKQSQSRFYRSVILLNLLIFLYSLYTDLSENRVLVLSIISLSLIHI